MTTTTRTSSSRRLSRSAKGAVIALVAGAGVALTPTAALANAAPVAAVAAPAAAPAPTHAAQVAVDTALAQVGKPYAWGGAGPSSYDCSGLVQFAYAAAGIGLPHSSNAQSNIGTPINVWDLQPGDLLFFYSPVSHVGIYIGNGLMVHASTYGQPVSVVAAASMPAFHNARRIA